MEVNGKSLENSSHAEVIAYIHKVGLDLFDLILFFMTPSTIFQLRWDGSSLVEPVLSYD